MPIDPSTVAVAAGERLWRAFKPINRVKRALNKRRARLGKPLLEINEDAEVEAVKGALKSKLVWLGVLQEVWAVAQLYLNGGDVSTEVLMTAVAGALTVLFRAVTNTSLADKAKG